MKRAMLESMLSFAQTRRMGGGEARDILDSDARQRAKLKKQAAEIRDLRALVENFVAQHHHTCRCVACTRLKNWRKP